MIKKKNLLKATPIHFSLITKRGNFDKPFLNSINGEKHNTIICEKDEDSMKEFNFIKKNIDSINIKWLNQELDYSFVYLVSKKWIQQYLNYLENKTHQDLTNHDNDDYKELIYFNQDILEKETISEKFYRYYNDFRGLNFILKDGLTNEDFQILDLNTMNFIKLRFKGNLIRREIKKKIENENIIDFIPLKIKIIKLSKNELQKFYNPEIYPGILTEFLEEKFIQVFNSMNIIEFAHDILKIFNKLEEAPLIPDISLIRLWKIDENIEISDLINDIRAHFQKNKEFFKIKIRAKLISKHKENKFQDFFLQSYEKIILEIKDSPTDHWFFDDSESFSENKCFSNMKRNFLSFLNDMEEDEKNESLMLDVKPNKKSSIGKSAIITKNYENSFSFLSKTFENNENKAMKTYKNTVGIQNLGETCYINVILQFLFHIEPIKKFFLESKYKDDNNYDSKLCKSLEEIFKSLSNGETKSISPFKFYDLLKEKLPAFGNYLQNDAHDFFLSFLDRLCSNSHFNSFLIKQKKKLNIFEENFLGILANNIVCLECKQKTSKYEPFFTLSLPISLSDDPWNDQLKKNEKLENFWRTYLITEDPKKNFRIICLNINLSEKILKSMTLKNFKQHIKKEMNISNSNDLVLVASNEKIILKMFENNDENIFEIYSQERKENHYMSFIEINLDSALSCNFVVFISLSLLTIKSNIETDSFLTLPRLLFVNPKESLTKQINDFIKNLVPNIWKDSFFNEAIENLFEIKFRLYNIFENLKEEDICENCKKNNCTCKSFISDSYFYEKENLYEKSNSKPFIKIVFSSQKLSEEQIQNLFLLKKSIRLDQKNDIKLFDCFSEFTTKETLTPDNKWFCSKCKEHRQATKQIKLFCPPRYLILQLKRFISQNSIKKKITVKIDFPIENLRLKNIFKFDSEYSEILKHSKEEDFNEIMSNFFKSGKNNNSSINNEFFYELIGVVNHVGESLENGHYFAYFYNDISRIWFKFDDKIVKQETQENICSENAYLLLYKKIMNV